MILAVVWLLRNDAVRIDVDITPVPTPVASRSVTALPSMLSGGSLSPAGIPAQEWLAATGIEPAWSLVGAAVVLVSLGLLRLHASFGDRSR